jgi:hypothetical protein
VSDGRQKIAPNEVVASSNSGTPAHAPNRSGEPTQSSFASESSSSRVTIRGPWPMIQRLANVPAQRAMTSSGTP